MRFVLKAVLLSGLVVGAAPVAIAGDAGLYGHRTVVLQHHAPRHGGPNEDSYTVTRDDRGVVACYDATYYPAKYRVDPQGIRMRGTRHVLTGHGDRYVKRRMAPVYLETRTRTKEDYVSLRRVHCR